MNLRQLSGVGLTALALAGCDNLSGRGAPMVRYPQYTIAVNQRSSEGQVIATDTFSNLTAWKLDTIPTEPQYTGCLTTWRLRETIYNNHDREEKSYGTCMNPEVRLLKTEWTVIPVTR